MHLPKKFWQYESLAEQFAKRRQRATIDFETRSARPIRDGSWLYAKHRSTRVLCLSFLLPGQDPLTPSLWFAPVDGLPAVFDYPLDEKGEPYSLERLFTHIKNGGYVEAHNVNFEANIWLHLFMKPEAYDVHGCKGMSAPPVADYQWLCSAAKAAAMALPRKLEQAGPAMDLPPHLLKSETGKRLLDRYSKPRKPAKHEPKIDELGEEGPEGEPFIYWHTFTEEDRDQMGAYCRQDVVAEHALSDALPDLDERERRVWLADFRANRRGVLIDVALVKRCIRLEAEVKAKMNETLKSLTICDAYPEGIRGSERAKILAWLEERGTYLPDSTAPTLDHLMASQDFGLLDDDVQTVIRIARSVNKTSVSKFKRILASIDDDNRVRELVLYYGAATGRWAGKGIQVQNFPKGDIPALVSSKDPDGSKVKAKNKRVGMAEVVKDIMTGDLAWLEVIYGDVLAVLSFALRGTLIPAEGKVFYVADYSAIEARVVLWLADAVEALQVFYEGKDIYCDMASRIYRRPINKDDHPKERGFGKVAILGLGYGMGWITFLLTLRSYKIKFTEKDAAEILGDDLEKYVDWIHNELWPERPSSDDYKDEEDYREDYRKWKTKDRAAKGNLRRLRDEREVPEDMIVEMALCKYVVDTYRKSYPEVKKLWALQEEAAVKAVARWKKRKMERDEEIEKAKARGLARLKAGKTFYWEEPPEPEPIFVECGKVTWYVEGRWLFCVLPSGRKLVYNCPDVKGTPTPWGEKRLGLRFMGVHKKTKKWARMSTYGGSIVENIDQATARDMMADALARIDAGVDTEADFELLASIHDEAISEGPVDGYEDEHMEEYRGLMKTLAPCYEGCPVEAEGKPLARYQK
jgi:DNA polymerase